MMLHNGEDIVGDNWGCCGGVGSVTPYEGYEGTVPRYRTPFVEFECVGLWYAVPRMYSE